MEQTLTLHYINIETCLKLIFLIIQLLNSRLHYYIYLNVGNHVYESCTFFLLLYSMYSHAVYILYLAKIFACIQCVVYCEYMCSSMSRKYSEWAIIS